MSEIALILDTETSGKADFKSPPDAPHQPRLVQLAWVLASSEHVFAVSSQIIKPDGWIIPPEVAEIHGITTETAEAYGVDVGFALVNLFEAGVRLADVIVAHNIAFDDLVLRSELARLDDHNPILKQAEASKAVQKPRFCTMKTSIGRVKAPFPQHQAKYQDGRGRGGQWKYPTLSECIKHYFGEDLVGAHDALIDVQACARIYWHLQSYHWKEPTESLVADEAF